MEDGGEGDYGLGAEKGRSEIWEEGGKHYGEQKLPWGGLGLDQRAKTTIQHQPCMDVISRKWFGSVGGLRTQARIAKDPSARKEGRGFCF